jgi:hypothetical protein
MWGIGWDGPAYPPPSLYLYFCLFTLYKRAYERSG